MALRGLTAKRLLLSHLGPRSTRLYSTAAGDLLRELRGALVTSDRSKALSVYSQIRKEPHLFAQLKATEFRDLLCGGPEKPSESTLSPTDEIVADMRNHPTVRPSVIEYNLLASSHVEDWTVGDALGFLGTMRSEGVRPDQKTYEHLVKAVIGRKDIEGAERLVVDEMNRDGVKGNVAIYGFLAEAYVEKGRRDAADNVLNEIGNS